MMQGILIVDKPTDWTSFDVIAKLRGILESCGAAFSKMARGADKLMEKAQRGKEPEEQKQSVKSELRQLKTEHSEKAKAPVSKEQAR